MRIIYYFWKNRNIRQFDPRLWSNDELTAIASLFDGDIVNVSAGLDKDKEGREYRDYFTNARSYALTNYVKVTDRDTEIILDLDVPLSRTEHAARRFDVVMSHTVLEHVCDIETAVKNLCTLTNDVVITIVPFIQAFHHARGVYSDYWRFTPFALLKLFEKHGLATIYASWNTDPLGNIYIFHVASKKPDKWQDVISPGWSDGIEGPGYNRNLLVYNLNYCKNVIIDKVQL